MPFEMSCGHCGSVLYWGMDVKSPREVLKQEGFRCRNCGMKLCQEFDVDVDPSGNIIRQISTQRALKLDQQSLWPPSTKKR